MDTKLRELERKASTDPEAQSQLEIMQTRAEQHLSVDEIKDKLENVKARFIEEAEHLVFQLCKPVLAKHSNVIDMITWEQYTPHFSDGDPCVFSYCGFSDATEYYVTFKEPYESGHLNTSDEKTFEAAFEDLRSLDMTLSMMESTLQTIFGDHVRVLVDLDGISTEQYSDHH